MVDGDEVRRMLGSEYGTGDDAYTLPARRVVAERIASLCGWLDDQGMNVVCCTISLFGDLHARNRSRFGNYFEVFVDVPLAVAERRDLKGIYASARKGERHNVIGIDLPFVPPSAPDMIVDNSEDGADPELQARRILGEALAA